LEQACAADRISAIDEPLAPFADHDRALLGRDDRREREVFVRRDVPEVGHLGAEAEHVARVELRRKEARLARHRRVRRVEVRQVHDRIAEHLDLGILEVDRLFDLVVQDAGCLHLPLRRCLRIVFARLAGRVDAALEHGVAAVLTLGARGRQARLVDGFDMQRIDKPVAELIVEVHSLGDDHFAVGFGQPNIAFSVQALGALIVDDAVSVEHRAEVVDLHLAESCDALCIVVVTHRVRLNEHLRVGIGRTAKTGETRSCTFRDRGDADPSL
jgi:hypothetical protein